MQTLVNPEDTDVSINGFLCKDFAPDWLIVFMYDT